MHRAIRAEQEQRRKSRAAIQSAFRRAAKLLRNGARSVA
jgi:hypothetical protein